MLLVTMAMAHPAAAGGFQLEILSPTGIGWTTAETIDVRGRLVDANTGDPATPNSPNPLIWEIRDAGSNLISSGIAIGTNEVNPSDPNPEPKPTWVAKGVRLTSGINHFTISASAPSGDFALAGIDIYRIDRTQMVDTLRVGGEHLIETIFHDNSYIASIRAGSSPVLSPGNSLVEVTSIQNNLNIESLHLLIDGVVVGSASGFPGTFDVDLSDMIDGPHLMSLVADVDDGEKLVETTARFADATDLNTGLRGYWSFNADAADESGNGFHGTLAGGASITGAARIGGGALDLRGVNGWVDLAGTPLDGSPACSMAAWVSTESFSPDSFNAIYANDGWSNSGIHTNLVAGDNHSEMALNGFGNGRMQLPADNSWVHLAWLYDSTAGVMQMWVDGTLVGALEGPTGVPCGQAIPVTVGAWDSDGAGSLVRFHDGRIDELVVYDRVLSGGEVGLLAAGAKPVPLAGLKSSALPLVDAIPITIQGAQPALTGQAPAWDELGPLMSTAPPAFLTHSAGETWLITGAAGREVTTTITGPDLQGVADEVEYHFSLSATAGPTDLLFCADQVCATWDYFSPSDVVGLPVPGEIVYTGLVPADGGGVWLGTTVGLFRLEMIASQATVVEQVSSLVGSWVSALSRDVDGDLWVGHRGSWWFTYHADADRRTWLDPGGVSRRQPSGVWTQYPAEQLDDGSWATINGSWVKALSGAGGGSFWAATELGITRFDGASWSHDTAEIELPGLLDEVNDLVVGSAAELRRTLVSLGTDWRYLDDGSNPGTAWREPLFDDSAWSLGPAQLGYGDGDEATLISSGSDPNDRHITSFYRLAFAATDVSRILRLDLQLLRDDGAIVYLNGQEVVRDNLPGREIQGDGSVLDPVNYRTLASSTVAGADEMALLSFTIDPALLLAGLNTLAVEIHQDGPFDTDSSFALSLEAFETVLGPDEAWAASGSIGSRELITRINDEWDEMGSYLDCDAVSCSDINPDTLAADGLGRLWWSEAGNISWWNPASPQDATVTNLSDSGGAVFSRPDQWLWAAQAGTTETRIGRYIDGRTPVLMSPVSGAVVDTDATGVADVLISWEPTPTADAYEVLVGGVPVARVTLTQHSLALRQGEHSWSIRPVLAGGWTAAATQARLISVEDIREREPAEMLIAYQTEQIPPGYDGAAGVGFLRLLNLHRARESNVWSSFVVRTGQLGNPRSIGVRPNGELLMATECVGPPGSYGCTTLNGGRGWIYNGDGSAFGQGVFGAVDASSEPGNFAVGMVGIAEIALQYYPGSFPIPAAEGGAYADVFDQSSEWYWVPGGNTHLNPWLTLWDVTGLPDGRVGYLAEAWPYDPSDPDCTIDPVFGFACHRIAIFGRVNPGLPVSDDGAIEELARIEVPFSAARLSGFVDGRIAVLVLDPASVQVYDLDGTLLSTYDLPISSVLQRPMDIAVDGQDRVMVTIQDGRLSTTSVTIFWLDLRSGVWQPQYVDIPAGAHTQSGWPIVSYRVIGDLDGLITGAPPGPSPPAGQESFYYEIGTTGIWLYGPGGFEGTPGNPCRSPGEVWVNGFLKTDGNSLTCASNLALSLLGSGLTLDYAAGVYDRPVVDASGDLPLQILPPGTSFTFDLLLGTFDFTGPVTTNIHPGGIDQVTFSELSMLGMGAFVDTTNRRGVVLQEVETVASYGGSGPLEINHIFLLDNSGRFMRSFGGVSDLAAPYDRGEVAVAGLPVRLRPTGEIPGTADGTTWAEFPDVALDVTDGSSSLFSFNFDVSLTAGALSVAPETAYAFRLDPDSDPVFEIGFSGGSVSSQGLDLAGVDLTLAGQTFTVGSLRAGASGIAVGGFPGLTLPGGIGANVLCDGVSECVTLLLPSGSEGGALQADGVLDLDLGQGQVTLIDPYLPFGFFESPPTAFPSVTGGSMRIGPANDPVLDVGMLSAPIFSYDRIVIPNMWLTFSEPRPFSFGFAGGAISRDAIELNDPPAVTIPGLARFDLGFSRLDGTGFYTESAVVTAQQISVSVDNLFIGSDGSFSISAGRVQTSGFLFELSNLTDTGSALSGSARFTFLPYVTNAQGDFLIGTNTFSLNNVYVAIIRVGPVDVKDVYFAYGRDLFPDMPPGDVIFAAAQVDVPKLPTIGGQFRLFNGNLYDVGVSVTFPPPGRPLPPPLQAAFLNSVEGAYSVYSSQLQLAATLTAGPSFELPGALIGTDDDQTVSLVKADLSFLFSSAGFRGDGTLTLFDCDACPGSEAAGARLAVGDLAALGIWGQSGYGAWVDGWATLFGGWIDGYAGFKLVNYGNPLVSHYWGTIRADFQVPPAYPLFPGKRLGYASIEANGIIDLDPALPDESSLNVTGTFGLDLGCTPWVETSCYSCESCIFGLCIDDWCCSFYDVTHCVTLDLTLTIDNDGVSFGKWGTDPAMLRGRLDNPSGLQLATNFRPLMPTARSKTLGQAVHTFEVTESAPGAMVRIDFTDYAGDADLTIRFPDGTLFTAQNTLELAFDGAIVPDYADGEIPIRRVRNIIDGPTPEESLKEVVYFFRGPFGNQPFTRYDADGNVVENFTAHDAGSLMLGTYEVTVEGSGAALGAPVQFLAGNNPPRMRRSDLEDIVPPDVEGDTHRVVWDLTDQDADAIHVQVHVASDPAQPRTSVAVGPPEGFFVGPGLPASVTLTTSFEFSLDRPELWNITTPHVLLSLVDGTFVGTCPACTFEPLGPRRFVTMGEIEPVADPLGPDRPSGVVVRPRNDGRIEVYWDPLCWTSPDPTTKLSHFAVDIEEIGPLGSTDAPLLISEEIPAWSVSGCGSEDPSEYLVEDDRLVAGRQYRLRVSAVSTEIQTWDGIGQRPAGFDPVCACSDSYPSDHYCSQPQTPVCDTASVLSIEHRSPASVPAELELLVTGNNAPRIRQVPSDQAVVGTVYAGRVVAGDRDSDLLTLTEIAARRAHSGQRMVRVTSPTVTINELSNGEWSLTFAPEAEHVGVHQLSYLVSDGEGGEAVLDLSLAVVWPVNAQGEMKGKAGARIVSDPPETVRLGDTFIYRADIAGTMAQRPVQFSLAQAPAGMSTDPITGLVVWVPGEADLSGNPHRVELRVTQPPDPATPCLSCPLLEVARQVFEVEVVPDPLAALDEAVLSLTPSEQVIDPDGGAVAATIRNVAVGNGSTLTWTAVVVEGDDWLTLTSGPAGVGNQILTLSATANPDSSDRVARIQVMATDLSSGFEAFRSPAEALVIQPGQSGPPRVAKVATIAGDASQNLQAGSLLVDGVTQLLVTFSEAVLDPTGSVSRADVSNPSSYQLVGSGFNGFIETTACGAIGGDDTTHSVTTASYLVPSSTVGLHLSGSHSLPVGRYQLRVCGDAGIFDLEGLGLDGNGDGIAGDDFVLEFEVITENLFDNPNFDLDLSGPWTIRSPQAGAVVHDQNVDGGGAPTSGSVAISNSVGPGQTFSLDQCVNVSAETVYEVGGLTAVTNGSANAPIVRATLRYFDGSACGGQQVSALTVTELVGDTAFVWTPLNALTTAPLGAASVRVSYDVVAGSAGSFDAGLDSLYFREAVFVIFADGFESGDSSAWSQ